ncbi:MAG TPA: phosphoribosyl-ATP pyrophosphatase [Cyanothece sp. UBA12306]|nr:phosphoribosyl-ATP pyrophosphatase [Cyanothece sp. UBA12306]
MPMPYDSWSFMDKQNYNIDGTMKPEHRKKLLEYGMSRSAIDRLEEQKIREVNNRKKLDARYLELTGMTYTQMEEKRKQEASEQEEAKRAARQKAAIRNCEDISELPNGIDPDEYYELLGNNSF